jgi:hypothetical membrane protein
MIKRVGVIATSGLGLLLVGVHDAHAYLDPATGSFFLQMLIGGIAGALVALKMYWSKVKTFFIRLGRPATDR